MKLEIYLKNMSKDEKENESVQIPAKVSTLFSLLKYNDSNMTLSFVVVLFSGVFEIKILNCFAHK